MPFKRVMTAILIILSLIIITKYLSPLCFFIMGLFWLIFAMFEFYRIAEKSGHKTFKTSGTLLAALVFGSFYFEWLPLEVLLVISIILVSILVIFYLKNLSKIIVSLSISLLGILYIGFLLGYQINIRLLNSSQYNPADLLILLYTIVGCQDAGGFIIGSLIGRHKISKVISPKKSLEGTIGSLAFGIAGSMIIRTFLLPNLALKHALILPVILGVFGLLGDLCESAFKRGANLKDSSAILPGHGGVLDRIDSILFCSPVFYYYFVLFISKELL